MTGIRDYLCGWDRRRKLTASIGKVTSNRLSRKTRGVLRKLGTTLGKALHDAKRN